MCNETRKQEQEIRDYRFVIYRIDQLENEEKENFKEIMKTLRILQEGLNTQNNKIIELQQRQYAIEEKSKRVDAMRETLTKHEERIGDHDRRLGIYQAVLIGVTIAVVGAIAVEIINVI